MCCDSKIILFKSGNRHFHSVLFEKRVNRLEKKIIRYYFNVFRMISSVGSVAVVFVWSFDLLKM